MKVRTVRAARVKGKRVLVTAELNVVRDERGRIVDDSRLKAAVPTIKLLLRNRARVVVATHVGRPNGRVVPALRTAFLARPLAKALGINRVQTVRACVGPKAAAAVSRLRNGTVLLLENTRFHRGEERNNPAFARQLAQLADVFVLDSFGTAHRKHASIVGVGRYLPAYAGLRFAQEVEMLSRVVQRPYRPLVAIMGGAKISTKLGLIASLLHRVDSLLLGGALANTILRAQGLQIGASLVEPSVLKRVRSLKLTNPRLHIPVDVMVGGGSVASAVRAVGNVKPQESILDIGPDTVALFSEVVRRARTVVWNGPMGKYEHPPFDRGTKSLARVVARTRAFTLVGGGETVDALRSQRLLGKISFISTGGGAMLEFLEGRRLPGVELVRVR